MMKNSPKRSSKSLATMSIGVITGIALVVACGNEPTSSGLLSLSNAIGAQIAKAIDITFDASHSGSMMATVQGAIDELFDKVKAIDDTVADHEQALQALQGGGSTACPAGMGRVHDGVCMDQTLAQAGAAKTFVNADADCRSFNKRLCTAGELISGCAANPPIPTDWQIPGTEWSADIDNVYYYSKGIIYPYPDNKLTAYAAAVTVLDKPVTGGGACFLTSFGKIAAGIVSGNNDATVATNAFRCCLNR